MPSIDIRKAAGIILKNKKLLLEKSKTKEFFLAPGGTIEIGETPKQALVREIREEFGIDIDEKDLEEFGTFVADAAGKPGKVVELTAYIIRTWEGEPIPNSEVEQIIWVDSKVPQDIKLGSIIGQKIIPRLKSLNLIS